MQLNSSSPLSNSKEDLIKNFLREFLPPSEEDRKYSQNKFLFVHEIISKLFSSFAKTKITEEELIVCFVSLEYRLLVGKTAGRTKTAQRSKQITGNPITYEYYRDIHINVSSAAILDFENVLKSQSRLRNPETIQQRSFLKEELTLFFNRQHNT